VLCVQNTVTDIKRLIGRRWDDPELQEELKCVPRSHPLQHYILHANVESNSSLTPVPVPQVPALRRRPR
jgi:hypothetical protein